MFSTILTKATPVVVALSFLFFVTDARLDRLQYERGGLSNLFPRDTTMTSYSNDTVNAHMFEESYRAHPSVSQDPFYVAPQTSANATAGTLLKVEKETNTSLYTIAPNLAISRFMYQSKTSNGSLVPVSAYVLWPYIARPHHDGYPVVAWAHGTSGSAPECAPSNIRNLWDFFQAPYQLALLGYVVVATDYAGLGVAIDASGKSIVHEYITGPAQANDVFYSIPAARKAFPELSEDFVVIGSSQGGSAAWAFAQKLAAEPMTGHLGTIALSPLTRMLSLPLDEPIIPFLLLFLAPTLKVNYNPFDPSDIFTPEGLQSLETLTTLKGCTTVAYQIFNENTLKVGWQNNTSVQKYQAANINGGQEIRGPLLVIQGGDDPIVYHPTVEYAVNKTLEKFPNSQIEYHLLPNVTHEPAMYAGLQIYVEWIAARFAGQPPKSGYHSQVATPARPASAQQTEANWFIQIVTEPWQLS